MRHLSKLKKHFTIKTLIGVILGALGVYLYYNFIGCSNGSCPISSSPISSILYGMLIGLTATIK